MKFHLYVFRAPRGRGDARRCTSVLAMAFICASLFVASQTASRAAAQSRFDRDTANRVDDLRAKPAQDAKSATPQTSAAVVTPADTDGAILVPEASVPSAPVPQLEDARLASPASNPFLAFAQENGQSSSSENLPSGAPAAQPRAVKSKSAHHGLGVALAIVGSAALVVGVAAYALGNIDICSNEKSGGCKEARDAGLVLMPVGAGVAITGFYLQFHR